ncbi:uncharacterized protein BKA78DRAFT_348506 [Phyllosticta capitalensis]|uniref:uncharacterized protein n=1 Tax=Phyllosticta capitalensis TaxID=121624 RepID=UPI00312FA8CD
MTAYSRGLPTAIPALRAPRLSGKPRETIQGPNAVIGGYWESSGRGGHEAAEAPEESESPQEATRDHQSAGNRPATQATGCWRVTAGTISTRAPRRTNVEINDRGFYGVGANIRDDGISSGGGGGDDDDGIELDTAFKSRHPTSPRYWDRVQQQSRAPQSDNTNDGGGKLLGGALSGPLA